MRPSFNFSEAVGKGGGSWSGDGKFSGNEELDIISHVGVRCCQGEACRGLTGDNQAMFGILGELEDEQLFMLMNCCLFERYDLS